MRNLFGRNAKAVSTGRYLKRSLAIVAVVMMVTCVGCTPTPRISYTQQKSELAVVPGYSGVRAWANSNQQEYAAHGMSYAKISTGEFLALSGGGSDGAFGAGVLVGWTKSRTRPQFDIVTGVSVGALIAPFAFLGQDHDATLTTMFTSGVTKDVAEQKWLPIALLGDSLLKPEAFYRLVETFATPQLLADVAKENDKGRRLYVITTNIDAQRPVLWDLGKIAASGKPDALALFRKVLIASASIPGGFPPVLFDVASGGRSFQEMHTDGGAWTQVFIVPESLLSSASSHLPVGSGGVSLYIVANNMLAPQFELTTDSTLGILTRAYSTVIKSQTRSSLEAVYGFAQRTGLHFHVAAIDRTVPNETKNPFDVDYMRALYQLGFDEAASGRAWKSAPVFETSRIDEFPPLFASLHLSECGDGLSVADQPPTTHDLSPNTDLTAIPAPAARIRSSFRRGRGSTRTCPCRPSAGGLEH